MPARSASFRYQMRSAPRDTTLGGVDIPAGVVLSVLLERTASITLDPERAPRWVNSLMVRRYERLPLRLRR
jgi:hypothetical protein